MNKKKIKIILIIILALILSVLIAIGIRFRNTVGIIFDWDNIVSFVNSVRYNNDDLETKIKDNQTKMEKVAEESNAGDKPLTVKGKGVVSKNALCPCGSGKKYKRCCGKDID